MLLKASETQQPRVRPKPPRRDPPVEARDLKLTRRRGLPKVGDATEHERKPSVTRSLQGPFRQPADVARLRDRPPRRSLRCSTEYGAEEDALRNAEASGGRRPKAQVSKIPEGAEDFSPFAKTTQRAVKCVILLVTLSGVVHVAGPCSVVLVSFLRFWFSPCTENSGIPEVYLVGPRITDTVREMFDSTMELRGSGKRFQAKLFQPATRLSTCSMTYTNLSIE